MYRLLLNHYVHSLHLNFDVDDKQIDNNMNQQENFIEVYARYLDVLQVIENETAGIIITFTSPNYNIALSPANSRKQLKLKLILIKLQIKMIQI